MASNPASARKPVKNAASFAAPKQAAKTTPAKKTATAKKATASENITLKAVFEDLAEGQNLPKKQAQALLAGMIETVTTHLKKGIGFG